MKARVAPARLAVRLTLVTCSLAALTQAPMPRAGAPSLVDRTPLRTSALHLERATRAGTFFDVVGRRAALLGYENRAFEAWVYPLEIFDSFALSFALDGDRREIDGRDVMSRIDVRPEATTLVYTHAAFTVRQIMFAPIDEPGAVALLEVDTVLPVTITVSFRPRLRLMWPGPALTGGVAWNASTGVYTITDTSGRYAGVVGSPSARTSAQAGEEPAVGDTRRLSVRVTPAEAARRRIPIVVAGAVDGGDAALASYERILVSLASLYDSTVDHYEQVDRGTLAITTPDERLNAAFRWAKIGIDKGIATNPLLGTGLLAGFRTADETERPGYAWFFGRDALWTALATTADGAFETTRRSLEFLRRFQRADGKIPHEISQSASLVNWFDALPYAWASADATPLYVVAHADYFRETGDRVFLESAWPSIVRAYRFSAATDTDGNGLIENTNVGHGWVEGGALYPPHEEIYLQGLWIAASRGIASLARAMHEPAVAADAEAAAERTRAAMEATYWNASRGFYDFATALPGRTVAPPEPGPGREQRQARLDELRGARAIDEDTVLPAVPLMFGTAEAGRAQREIDHLGSADIATDWGARILSSKSALYDPLAYHYGSVWPLFTGWSAAASYRYGRPHVGYQALMANALLTYAGALGDVTELMSGAFATSIDRASPHQVWSEAMVVSPMIRGLLGIEVDDGGNTVRFAPDLPATWNHVEARGLAAGTARFDLLYRRMPGTIVMRIVRAGSRGSGPSPSSTPREVFAPALPLDARVRRVTINGRSVAPDVRRLGDVQFVTAATAAPAAELICHFDEGTDVDADVDDITAGAGNSGLRVLRSQASASNLHLVLEGLAGRSYELRVRSPRRLGRTAGVEVLSTGHASLKIRVRFDGRPGEYVRRELNIPLGRLR